MPASARRTPRVSCPLVAVWGRSLLRWGVCIGLCALACVVTLAFHTERVAAAGYTVIALTDTGAGSGTTGDLRYAITQVNAGAGGDTITFSVTGPITLGSALPALNKNVAITGPTGGPGVTVQAAATPNSAAYGVFAVNNGVTASISNLTIANGNGVVVGGGIDNRGTVTVTNSTLSGNSATNAGGGIYSFNGTVTVTNSTFSGNSAPYGGGIYNFGTVTVTNSTLSGNSATSSGGVLLNNGGTVRVTNSTLSGNSASGNGGGIFNAGTLTVTNTIVAGNTAPTGPDINGAVVSHGHNLIGTTSGTLGITSGMNGDLANPTPLLSALGSYGGLTQTVALLPGSPAIDAGDDSVCNQMTGAAPVNTQDQRGITRPVGAHCDIGAFESQGFTLTRTSGDSQRAPVTTAFAPLVVTVASSAAGAADNEPVNGGVVTFAGPGSGADITPDPQTATIGTTTSGQASITPTANGTPGAYTVKATATGTTPAFVSFSLLNIGPATQLVFTPQPTNPAVAGTPFPIKVTAEDVNGNPDTTYAGTITLAPSIADPGATGLGPVTPTNGVVTFSVTLTKATTGQTLVATASVNGNTITGTSAAFAVTAAAPATITGAPPSESAAVTTTFSALTATVKDTYGNPVPGITVTLAATPAGNGATLGGGTLSQTTDVNGVATFADLTANTKAGTHTVATTAPSVTTPASFTLTNTAGAPGNITAMAGTPQSAPVTTTFPVTLAVLVADLNGNAVPQVTVTFTAPASGASGTFAGGGTNVTIPTSAQGVASAPALTANDTTGGYSVTATVSGVGTAARFSLTNTAAALRSIAFSIPASVGSPPSVKVGQTVAFTAMGTYADGSTQELSSQVQWSSDTPGVVTVDAAGKVTGESPGTGTITATLNGVAQRVVVTVAGPTPVGITVPPVPAARPGGAVSAPGSAPAPAPAPRSSGGAAAPGAATSGPSPAPIPVGR